MTDTEFQAKIAKLNERIHLALALDKHATAARAQAAFAKAWADRYAEPTI